jgi:hypothetical protein
MPLYLLHDPLMQCRKNGCLAGRRLRHGRWNEGPRRQQTGQRECAADLPD